MVFVMLDGVVILCRGIVCVMCFIVLGIWIVFLVIGVVI